MEGNKIMNAVLINENGILSYEYVPIPKPGKGEVLIRIAAAPINPSDLNYIKNPCNSANVQKIPGYEGSGTVITSGGGLLPGLLRGKRVAFAGKSGGAWAEYTVASAGSCFPLPKKISFEQGSMSFVNPLTAIELVNIAIRDKHKAVINTAASSALGKMIFRLCRKENLPVINIVRRKEQAKLLQTMGAEYVISTSETDFSSKVNELAHELNSTLILDAVSGELTQKLLNAAPYGSTAVVYGILSGKTSPIDTKHLLSENKSISGFSLRNLMAEKNIMKSVIDLRKSMLLLDSDLTTDIQNRLPLSDFKTAIEIYNSNPTAGKVILFPKLN